MRFGSVAIVGRSNVGKSTFLNAILGEPLAIVSKHPQTTRDRLLGVLHRPDAQIAFYDTPGLHRPRTELGRRMNTSAEETARAVDAILFVTDVGRDRKKSKHAVHPQDAELLASLPGKPVVVAINKVDLLRDKSRLLPILEAFAARRELDAIVPISALNEDGTERVLEELVALVPEGDAGFDTDTLTDRPTRFFVREYVREQVMRCTRAEVPHAVAVTVDEFEQRDTDARIRATVHVEKPGQRAVVLGRRGTMLKRIGQGARARLELLVGHPVHLDLFVRVTPRWKSAARRLAEVGYDAEDRRDVPEMDGAVAPGESKHE